MITAFIIGLTKKGLRGKKIFLSDIGEEKKAPMEIDAFYEEVYLKRVRQRLDRRQGPL